MWKLNLKFLTITILVISLLGIVSFLFLKNYFPKQTSTPEIFQQAPDTTCSDTAKAYSIDPKYATGTYSAQTLCGTLGYGVCSSNCDIGFGRFAIHAANRYTGSWTQSCSSGSSASGGATNMEICCINPCTVPNTPTPPATNTPIPTATNTPIPTATNTPIPTATNTPIPTATNTPIPTKAPVIAFANIAVVPTNTPIPTATNTPVPTVTSTPIPTPTNTPLPTSTSVPDPTATATMFPVATSTLMPTSTPTLIPTATPTPRILANVIATATPIPTAKSQQELPKAGGVVPTLLFTWGGMTLLYLGLIFRRFWSNPE